MAAGDVVVSVTGGGVLGVDSPAGAEERGALEAMELKVRMEAMDRMEMKQSPLLRVLQDSCGAHAMRKCRHSSTIVP